MTYPKYDQAEAKRLVDAVKARHPLKKQFNAGWESRAQVRPSTGTPDQKESYQITRPHMAGIQSGRQAPADSHWNPRRPLLHEIALCVLCRARCSTLFE